MSTIENVPGRVHAGTGGTKPDIDAVDVGRLKHRLKQTVRGEVRFDAGTRAVYANDSSNFRQVPLGAVLPETPEDIVAAHRACAAFGAPIVNRGGGTSLSGETVNRGVVIDTSKHMTAIGDVDREAKVVRCQPGAVNEHVNRKTGAQAGLIFGPDPSSHDRCTIGGNLGNNSCGIHSVQSQLYGPGPRFSDCVRALEVVTYDGARFEVGIDEEHEIDAIIAAGGRKGEIYAQLRDLRDRYADLIRDRFKSVQELPRRVSGYNLDELLPERGFNVARALVGTESTCATFTEVEIELMPALLMRTLVIVEYDDLPEAGNDIRAIVDRFRPIGLEAIDKRLLAEQRVEGKNLDAIRELPEAGRGEAWLLVQFGADSAEESEAQAQAFRRWLLGDRGYAEDRIAIERSAQEGGHSGDIWTIREAGLGATAFPPGEGDHWPGWEDSAVPPDAVGPYLRDLRELFAAYGYEASTYGHFGQGCIHCRIDFDLRHADGIERYGRFLDEAADLVVGYGGSLSGEHGDGQQRAAFLDKQYGPEIVQAFREFKRIWDPAGKMNPGKVVDPFPPDANLKLGPDYNPSRPPVKFSYRQDGGDFAHATLRCVGVGKCRVSGEVEQVMCPSYQATGEEEHSTRGRARLLWEMLRGEVIEDGWQSKEVYDALDLCLSCKGCTNDCPVNVDMPTYKSEFLYHHYRSAKRWRPRHAYAFGLIDQAARIASRVPGLVNAFTQTPPFDRVAKFAAGMDSEREIPTFAPVTLQEWFKRRGSVNPNGRRVILFPDTFNNHLHTDVGVACVEALEAAGWQVVMPESHMCCGRPLYDYGFLDLAERYLHRVLDTFREETCAPAPRSSAWSRAAWPSSRMSSPTCCPTTTTPAGWRATPTTGATSSRRFDVEVPRVARRALLWGHCHHKATGGMDIRAQAARAHGPRGRGSQRRLLRPGGIVGLRVGQARHLDGLRRAGTPARRARRRARDGHRRQRLLLQDANRAGGDRPARAARRRGDEARARARGVRPRTGARAGPRASARAQGPQTQARRDRCGGPRRRRRRRVGARCACAAALS